jgi:lysyl-tRNA synthetase class 2
MSDIKNIQSGSQEHDVRVEKVMAMRRDGIEPWPQFKEVTATCADVVSTFDDGATEHKTVAVAGRVISIREHGKTAFVVLQDRTGQLQVYIRQDILGDASFEFFKSMIDLGDIIWVDGAAFRTKMGQVTLKVHTLTLLSKSLYPLPEKFHGLTDIEVKYRQRYLDLIATQESRERFKKRSAIVRFIRNFLDAHDFMEVETPMLHPIAGGAAARPFGTHHNALDMQLFLRIAPELYLKRLVVGGFERVYEINRNFRNEGISTRHNPEFTMLEFYIAHKDVFWMMDFVQELLGSVVAHVCDSTTVPFGQEMLDFGKPFERMTMQESVMRYAHCSADDLAPDSIDAVLKKHNVTVDQSHASAGHKLVALFEALVEPHLVQPTFIYSFPIEVSPLSKRNPVTGFADRFELFIGRMELSNAFNELNDPFDQAERFKEQVHNRETGDVEAHNYDADYVHALEYALPPTAGCGIGIDRLVMLLTNTTSIKDVILFPTLKKQK